MLALLSTLLILVNLAFADVLRITSCESNNNKRYSCWATNPKAECKVWAELNSSATTCLDQKASKFVGTYKDGNTVEYTLYGYYGIAKNNYHDFKCGGASGTIRDPNGCIAKYETVCLANSDLGL
ncbi:UNVERIFIED_CONTAM: hypothetical protein HDU68_000593 [Siphonaria sp. JEL0065]|nr:hypothetical protein HDU68_000593 [Siphonaria sp. JEL0065]